MQWLSVGAGSRKSLNRMLYPGRHQQKAGSRCNANPKHCEIKGRQQSDIALKEIKPHAPLHLESGAQQKYPLNRQERPDARVAIKEGKLNQDYQGEEHREKGDIRKSAGEGVTEVIQYAPRNIRR